MRVSLASDPFFINRVTASLVSLPRSVKVGRKPGVYKTWDECKAQVDGFQGCKHKKFPTQAEAQAFVSGTAPPATTSTSSTSIGKGKGRALEGDEPAAKRQRINKSSDVVFGSQESKFPASRTVYSDGSSKGNGKKGAVAGSGVFWSHELGAK
jgi:ribonuclease HI